MLALQITDVKQFMNCLLLGDVFDNFLLSEAVISTKMTFSIDGKLSPDFFTPEEQERFESEQIHYVPFHYAKKNIFDMMKGTQTPSYLKIVLMLSPKNIANTLKSTGSSLSSGDVSGMFLNLTYQSGRLMCTTGISYRIFTTDKTLDAEWDRLTKKFLTKHEIGFEEL